MNDPVVLGVSDFVALLNQTLEYAYNSVTIVGELANFKISKNRWVYFDLKDEFASVRFFGTVYALPGPLEDGMVLEVLGNPRLHPQFGFSVNVQSMRPVGAGSIKKAANLLEAKLRTEGLFDEARKRPLPYPPQKIGLITSKESAAYVDFMKVLNHRWRGVEITLADVQVQGEAALPQIISAIEQFNQLAEQPDVLVLIRGGGSPDDLQVFSTEQVTRAVGASRIPTLVAIGHEVDVSLAELAADQRASTPSNAAELLAPDRRDVLRRLEERKLSLAQHIQDMVERRRSVHTELRTVLAKLVTDTLAQARRQHAHRRQLLTALDPSAALKRGYAIVRDEAGKVLKDATKLRVGAIVDIRMRDAQVRAKIETITRGAD